MAARVLLGFLLLFSFASNPSYALYEDQVGLADWHQKYVGKVRQAVFHTHKTGRKRVVVSTDENVIASLDLRTGNIFWRHVLGKDDLVNQIEIALGKYVVALSSEGRILRAWNLPDGQMIWESVLPVTEAKKSSLYISESSESGKDNTILISSGGCFHALSSIDGQILWKKDLSANSLDIYYVDGGIIYAGGFLSRSQFSTYHISLKDGELLQQSKSSFADGFSGESQLVDKNTVVALDTTRSSIVLIKLENGAINFHRTHISGLLPESFKRAELLRSKVTGFIALKTESYLFLIRVKNVHELEVVDKINHPSTVSDAIIVSQEQQAFAIVHHDESKIHFQVKLDKDGNGEVLKETVQADPQKGKVEKIFLNNYIKTDRSHGFRALLVMEDHSLLLVQQGEIVWSREEGLASIIDSTTSELPVEKEGVSVAEVEHSLFEWLKGHLLKLKGTLMLASPDEQAAIQAIRLKSSEKNKMTRDHNGFRKLIIVLTRAKKIFALHTGDGRVIWSLFLPSIQRLEACENLSALKIFQWQVPHHSMHESPSVVIVGRCGSSPDALGFLSTIDCYSGKEINSVNLQHSVNQVIPLPLTDSTEQRLHLIVDGNSYAHLYPKTSESLNIFRQEMSNYYQYAVDVGENIIRGFSFQTAHDLEKVDEHCFESKELWSVVFPSESERISTTATRKMNEVVHTQAKVIAHQDVMYKYISRNIVFVATVSPKAAGDIGSATPEESCLVAYLIDAVSGRILHRVTHQGAQGPIHTVVSENWVVYHYFNVRAHRFEMSVIEIYDESRADNKDIWKLILGKHNLLSPISSYSRPEVLTKSQSYFFTHSVKDLAVTTTAKGITSKQLLIGTVGDQILALDKRFLDPRRSANPTEAEKEEGIMPLTDSLPIIPQSYVTHGLQVGGLRGIVTFPAKLESTALVFSYGVDIFYTRIAPSRTYDSLTEDFNYALLLITIVALVVAIIVTWIWSEKKELREKWR